MTKSITLEIEQIKKMSYTQFVAFINQWNVPPGSLSTISEWSVFGHVKNDSKILEIACTTGFSGRELSRLTGCSVIGVDICDASIRAAKLSKNIYGDNLDLHYINADACTFEFEQKFSHIVLGAALGFFKEPNTMLCHLKNYFNDSGYILASPYFGIADIPNELIKQCQSVIGITPTAMPYSFVRNVYENFEIVYESRKRIELETQEQMKKYTEDTIQRCCNIKNITSEEIYQVLFNRLYEIKSISNELHKYQAYSVMVLRYLKEIYPNRFMELF